MKKVALNLKQEHFEEMQTLIAEHGPAINDLSNEVYRKGIIKGMETLAISMGIMAFGSKVVEFIRDRKKR